MTIQRTTGLDERAFSIRLRALTATGYSYAFKQRRRMFSVLVATGMLSPFAAFAQTGMCRVTHIDFHQRRALQSVESLITMPYVLSSYPYVPVSSEQRQRDLSEASRIAPEIVAKRPDVIIVHGSTFTGSANIKQDLGELVRIVYEAKRDIHGFLVYSSAPLDAAAISIEGPLRNKVVFMYAPIVNRFRRTDPSAKALQTEVRKLCEIVQ